MSNWTDTRYLQNQQYKTDANLSVRQRIHQLFSLNPQPIFVWLAGLAELAEFGPEHRVMDLGCGNGRFWQETQSPESPASFHVTLVDLSLGMVQTARQTIQGRVSHWQALQASAENLPFADRSYDCIMANFMLYHVSDPEQAIAEFRRLLSPRGSLIVTLVGLDHMRELWQLSADILGSEDDHRGVRLFPEKTRVYLEKYFPRIASHAYEDALQVTDPDILWDYLLSGQPPQLATKTAAELDRLEADFKARVETDITTQGHFYIQKDTVVFICNLSWFKVVKKQWN